MKPFIALMLILTTFTIAGCQNPFGAQDDTNAVNYVLPRFENHQKPVLFKESAK